MKLFLIDSGATGHTGANQHCLENIGNIEPKVIILGDVNRLGAIQKGSLTLSTMVNESGRHQQRAVVLSEVLLVPKLRPNLIPCSKLCGNVYEIIMSRNECHWTQGVKSGFRARTFMVCKGRFLFQKLVLLPMHVRKMEQSSLSEMALKEKLIYRR